MLVWILLLLLILVIFGFGFTTQILWYVAAALLVLWLVGFVKRGRGGAGAGSAAVAAEPPRALAARGRGGSARAAITRERPPNGRPEDIHERGTNDQAQGTGSHGPDHGTLRQDHR
ncbi:hypothetical protein RB200_02505 [Streptomyces sp. PmtG]